MAGFVKIREGILEHIADGSIAKSERDVWLVLNLLTKRNTGLWFGNAQRLLDQFAPGEYTLREIRDVLRSLEAKGYIKRFDRPGSNRGYRFLIDKFEITFGEQRGKRTNAAATTDWQEVVYEDGTAEVTADVTEAEQQTASRRPAVSTGDIPACTLAPLRETEIQRYREEQVAKQLVPASGTGSGSPAKWVASALFESLGNPARYKNSATVKEWTREAEAILIVYPDVQELKAAMRWMMSDKFWPTRIFSMKNFANNIDTIMQQYRAEQSGAKNVVQDKTRSKRTGDKPVYECRTF